MGWHSWVAVRMGRMVGVMMRRRVGSSVVHVRWHWHPRGWHAVRSWHRQGIVGSRSRGRSLLKHDFLRRRKLLVLRWHALFNDVEISRNVGAGAACILEGVDNTHWTWLVTAAATVGSVGRLLLQLLLVRKTVVIVALLATGEPTQPRREVSSRREVTAPTARRWHRHSGRRRRRSTVMSSWIRGRGVSSGRIERRWVRLRVVVMARRRSRMMRIP